MRPNLAALAMFVSLLAACEPVPSRTAMTEPSCLFACYVTVTTYEDHVVEATEDSPPSAAPP